MVFEICLEEDGFAALQEDWRAVHGRLTKGIAFERNIQRVPSHILGVLMIPNGKVVPTRFAVEMVFHGGDKLLLYRCEDYGMFRSCMQACATMFTDIRFTHELDYEYDHMPDEPNNIDHG